MVLELPVGEVVVVVLVVDAVVAGGAAVVVVVAAVRSLAMACSKAAKVAASMLPEGGTPSAVWNFLSASVSSGVHIPSMGPVQ